MDNAATKPPAKEIRNDIADNCTDDRTDDDWPGLHDSGPHQTTNREHDRGSWNEHSDNSERLAEGNNAHDRARPRPMIGNELPEIANYAFHSVLKMPRTGL
ncbi:hypothetical protein FQZ97_824340 [compost metagenome]